MKTPLKKLNSRLSHRMKFLRIIKRYERNLRRVLFGNNPNKEVLSHIRDTKKLVKTIPGRRIIAERIKLERIKLFRELSIKY